MAQEDERRGPQKVPATFFPAISSSARIGHCLVAWCEEAWTGGGEDGR